MYHNNMWSLVKWFQMMVIRGHHISVIEDHAFAGLDQLAQLNIFECDLTFMPPVSDVKDTVSELHLDSNDISYVPYGYFQGFKKLHRLSLADNLLTELPDVTDLTSTLRSLEVQRNIITHFPNWMLNASMANWTSLHIFQNRIREFSPMIIRHQHRLKFINLRENDLTTLFEYPDVTWDTMTEVHIEYNPLHCDNSLAWQANVNHTGNDKVIVTGAVLYIGGQCESPQWLKERFLDDLGLYYIIT